MKPPTRLGATILRVRIVTASAKGVAPRPVAVDNLQGHYLTRKRFPDGASLLWSRNCRSFAGLRAHRFRRTTNARCTGYERPRQPARGTPGAMGGPWGQAQSRLFGPWPERAELSVTRRSSNRPAPQVRCHTIPQSTGFSPGRSNEWRPGDTVKVRRWPPAIQSGENQRDDLPERACTSRIPKRQ